MSLLVWIGTNNLGDDCDGSSVHCWSWINSQIDVPCKDMDYEKTVHRRLQTEQKQLAKAETMRKMILEEYRSGIPAQEVIEGAEEP